MDERKKVLINWTKRICMLKAPQAKLSMALSSSKGKLTAEQPKIPEDERARTAGRGNWMTNKTKSTQFRKERDCSRRQKERPEKEKAFKRKESNEKRETTLWDKGKETERTESLGNSERKGLKRKRKWLREVT